MKGSKWIGLAVATVFLAFGMATGGVALAQGEGHGHGHEKHGDDNDQGEHYRGYDHDAVRGWYNGHHNHLPPGLAKRDQLPPGLEKQLVERGTLPPGLRKRIEPCPQSLVAVLPPPPPDYEHVIIGGHVVLLNRRTYVVASVFHFELN